jgi:hypothetical protein
VTGNGGRCPPRREILHASGLGHDRIAPTPRSGAAGSAPQRSWPRAVPQGPHGAGVGRPGTPSGLRTVPAGNRPCDTVTQARNMGEPEGLPSAQHPAALKSLSASLVGADTAIAPKAFTPGPSGRSHGAIVVGFAARTFHGAASDLGEWSAQRTLPELSSAGCHLGAWSCCTRGCRSRQIRPCGKGTSVA